MLQKRFNDQILTTIAITIIIAINLYFYYLEVKLSNSLNITTYAAVKLGANYGKLSLHGQTWRLFSAMWLHLSFWHIASNMYALYLFSKIITPIYYTYQIILIYLISGLTGNIVSAIANPAIVSAGASTAISGLIGAMIALSVLPSQAINKAGYIKYGIEMLFLNTIGMIGTNVDIAGHAGGAAGGFIIGLIFSWYKRNHFFKYGY